MRKVTADDQAGLIRWAEKAIGSQFFSDAKAIGLLLNGEICAVVVFDRFSKCDCNMHIASDGGRRWMTREYLVEAFRYPFVQCGLRRVSGLVPSKNEQALRFDQKLGFVKEGVCRNAMIDDDIVILGMLRKDCLFIAPEYRTS